MIELQPHMPVALKAFQKGSTRKQHLFNQFQTKYLNFSHICQWFSKPARSVLMNPFLHRLASHQVVHTILQTEMVSILRGYILSFASPFHAITQSKVGLWLRVLNIRYIEVKDQVNILRELQFQLLKIKGCTPSMIILGILIDKIIFDKNHM